MGLRVTSVGFRVSPNSGVPLKGYIRFRFMFAGFRVSQN